MSVSIDGSIVGSIDGSIRGQFVVPWVVQLVVQFKVRTTPLVHLILPQQAVGRENLDQLVL